MLATPRPAEAPAVIAAYGGHHDAGDYNPRSHLDVAQTLMDAYEMAPQKFYDGQLNIPEKGNGIPDILDKAHWACGCGWTSRTRTAASITAPSRPATRISSRPSSSITSATTPTPRTPRHPTSWPAHWPSRATLVVAGQGREPDDFLRRARRAYGWAENHPPQAKTPQQYAFQYLGPRAYAAAQLLHTTSEPRFDTDFRGACSGPQARRRTGGLYRATTRAWRRAYVNCPAAVADARLQASVRRAILIRADMFIRQCQTMAYGFIRHPMAPINWGTGAYENYLPVILWSYKLTGDDKYRAGSCGLRQHPGRQSAGCSYIVGLGTRAPSTPRCTTAATAIWARWCRASRCRDPCTPAAAIAWPRSRILRCATTSPPCRTSSIVILRSTWTKAVVASQAKTMAAFGLLLGDRHAGTAKE